MLALMYVKRLKDNNNSQYLSQVSSTDLFLISVASTFLINWIDFNLTSSVDYDSRLRCHLIDVLGIVKTDVTGLDYIPVLQ